MNDDDVMLRKQGQWDLKNIFMWQKILNKSRDVGEVRVSEMNRGTTGKYGYIEYYNHRAPGSKVVRVWFICYLKSQSTIFQLYLLAEKRNSVYLKFLKK